MKKLNFPDRKVLVQDPIKRVHEDVLSSGGGSPHSHGNLTYLETLNDPIVDENINQEIDKVFVDPNQTW